MNEDLPQWADIDEERGGTSHRSPSFGFGWLERERIRNAASRKADASILRMRSHDFLQVCTIALLFTTSCVSVNHRAAKHEKELDNEPYGATHPQTATNPRAMCDAIEQHAVEFAPYWRANRATAEVRTTPLPHDEFQANCLKIPVETRRCLFEAYRTANESSCRTLLLRAGPSEKAVIDVLFLGQAKE